MLWHMETNPPSILQQLQARIGQVNSDSPSPMGAWLAGTLVAVSEGHISLSYTVRHEMTNPAGILHGGAIAAMLDDVIGMTVYSLGRPDFLATTHLHIDYLAAVREGACVTASSQLVRSGRQRVHATAELRDAEGKLLAMASSSLLASPYSRRSAPAAETP